MGQHKNRLSFVCRYCGTPSEVKKSQLRAYKGAGRFCSRACHYSYYRENPTAHACYREQKQPDIAGYIPTYVTRDGKNKKIREHRLVMERHLGRPLLKTEVVHHRNHIKTDNRIENLEIMTKSEHHRHHAKERKTARWLRAQLAELGEHVGG